MKTREYVLNCGQYVYMVDGEPTTAPADVIALCFDADDGTVHKHGDPVRVQAWYLDHTQKLRAAGMNDWADHLVVIEGRFPLDEVNKMLSTSGYAKPFYEKLKAGQVLPQPYGFENETSIGQTPGAHP